MSTVTRELTRRTQSSETKMLEEENTRLKGEIEGLKRRLEELEGRVFGAGASMRKTPPGLRINPAQL